MTSGMLAQSIASGARRRQLAKQHEICGVDLTRRLVLYQHHLVIGWVGVVFPAQRVDQPRRIDLELVAVDGVELSPLRRHALGRCAGWQQDPRVA
jgi:hypothetical protein